MLFPAPALWPPALHRSGAFGSSAHVPRPQAAAQPHFSSARIEDDEIYGRPFFSFPPPALACELFMELSGQCRLMLFVYRYPPCSRSISLPVFRSQRRASAFWSRNPPFSASAAHLCGMCKTSLGESYFPPNHNLIAIRQLQTAQTARGILPNIDRRKAWRYAYAKRVV